MLCDVVVDGLICDAACVGLVKCIVLRYNLDMRNRERVTTSSARLQVLAEFRHQLRLFLQFSETAAQEAGLHPQQHQLLLQIAGARVKEDVTIGYLAERLGLRHNTLVELSDRCEQAGLAKRRQAGADRRRVLLEVTPKGRQMLEALSIDHARELNERAPQLVRALSALKTVRGRAKKISEQEGK
jgi:DNA-binding MarR family transcriptional regulator